jgi:DNA-binding SARP family transcriptional activator
MIHVRTLGESLIEVRGSQVRPDATLLFAVLLYLSVERGRRVERDALCALLWPRADATRRKHNLRQILYKLNRMGVSTGDGSGPLILNARDVWLDFEDATAGESANESDVWHSAGGKALPGYAPRFSSAFRVWLDELRARAESSARRRIVSALAHARREASWEAVERLARMCLQLDPLNEEATLALAEATALTGSKQKAIAMLDTYVAELGPGAGEARLPAQVLRRRISDRLPRRGRGIIEAAFVGRDDVMRELTAIIDDTKAGHASTHLLYGPQGIGKTRVVQEMGRGAALTGAVVVSQRAAPDDAQTPGLTLTRLFRALLAQPGSLGLAPDVLSFLRRVTAQSPASAPVDASTLDSSEDALVRALVDLERALAWEATLVLTLDDVHFSDELTRRIVNRAQGCLTDERVLLVLTGIDETSVLNGSTGRRQLRRLDPEASLRLARSLLEQLGEAGDAEHTRALAAASGGHPFVLREAVLASRGRGGPASLDSIEGILQYRCSELSDAARELLLTALILGEHANVAMLLSGTTLSGADSERAVVELEDAQILACESGGAVHVHSLWLNALERIFPAGQIAARRLRVAQLLDAASRNRSDAAELLLSSAAQFQRAGDSDSASTTLARGGAVLKDRALGSAAHSAYSRAAQLAGGEQDFDICVLRALMASSDAQMTQEAASLLAEFGTRLRESTHLNKNDKVELAVIDLETHSLATNGDPAVPARCLALLDSGDLSQSQQLRIALIGAQIAEHSADIGAVRQIEARTAGALQTAIRSDRIVRELGIVLAVANADLARAKDLAEEHIASVSDAQPPSERARMLLNARIPFWFDSDLARVDELLRRIRIVVDRYPSTTQAFRIEDAWVTHCIDIMQLDEAEQAIASARQLASALSLPGQHLSFLEASERLRVARGESGLRIGLGPSVPSGASRFGRARTFALSNEVVLAARAGEGRLAQLVTDLSRGWDALRRSCPFDYPCAALAIGLSALGKNEDAKHLWCTYRGEHRVASNEPSPFVQALSAEFNLPC